ADGAVVRAIPAPGAGTRSRSFFDKLVDFGKTLGLPGLAYIVLGDTPKGPIAKFLDADRVGAVARATGAAAGDAVFFVCDAAPKTAPVCHALRARLGEDLGIVEADAYRFCWVTDYPFYERDPDTGKIEFSHNPFSMPQGGLAALNEKDPLDI